MIDEIRVKNLALIARAGIEPCDGLTVLTGETGAGKTALLTALKLLMGERADKTLVRDGADELQVSGRFFFGGDEVVAQRRVSADGRSRVTLDGEMAGVGELTTRIAPSVDLCSQNEHQQLLRPATHVRVLDGWIGAPAEEALAAYGDAYREATAAKRALDELDEAQGAGAARLDEARFVMKRIGEVNPKPGEYEDLLADLARAEHAEALFAAAENAYNALSGDGFGAGVGDGAGAADLLVRAAGALEGVAKHDPKLGELAQELKGAAETATDVAFAVRSYRDGLEFDEEALVLSQMRVASMQGLMRSFGPRMEDVFARWEQAKALVAATDDGDLLRQEAERRVARAEEALAKAQAVLHEVRAQAAPRLAKLITDVMGRLEMGSACLECRVEPLPRQGWTAAGGDGVEFLFKPGSGMGARPLAKIASGGEISRVMLAIKVVLGEHDSVDTLVFDEIDAGVGGATALAMAQVIGELSRTH